MKNQIRRHLVSLLLFTVAGLCVAQEKPNVVFIAIDDLNDWNGVLKGHPQVRTPNLDRLAAMGLTFTNAHCAAPACGPSRSAIMTGIRPSTSGNYHNAHSFVKNETLNKALTLAEMFQQNGYYTMGSGKLFHGNHFNNELKGRGFDEYFPDKTRATPADKVAFPKKRPLNGIKVKNWSAHWDWGPYRSDVTLDHTSDGQVANWAAGKLSQSDLKEPFFLGVGIFRPHLPFYAPQPYFDNYPTETIQLPTVLENDLGDVPPAGQKMGLTNRHPIITENQQWPAAVAAYLASISMMDDCLGKVLDALENSDYVDNTIIVLWSDHGYQLGEKEKWAKFTLWERATRVNMIWAVPDVTPMGKTCPAPVNLIDVYPTLVSLTGGRPPSRQLEGQDLSPLLKKPKTNWPTASLTIHGYRNYSVRTKRYRYISYHDGGEEFYDLKKDPNEWNNLTNGKKYRKKKEKLIGFLPETHAPEGPK